MCHRRHPPRGALMAGSLLLAAVMSGLGSCGDPAAHGADGTAGARSTSDGSGTATPSTAPPAASTPAPAEVTATQATAIPATSGGTTKAPSAPAGSGDPTASFRQLRSRLHARSLGLVYAPLGDPHPVRLGDWQTGPAWSTIKVPLGVAALRRSSTGEVPGLVHRAITESDNAAAEALWGGLGNGQPAATAVDSVLADHGDRSTRTQSRQVRPPYTPFGQTTWSLTNQVTFVSKLYCSGHDTTVVREMTHISSAQAWGLGRLKGATFKGGWGPDPSGRYLVRQFGVVTIGSAQVAVAVAVEPDNGSFGRGTQNLDLVAAWLRQNVHPASGSC
jgi:hypothetical protein